MIASDLYLIYKLSPSARVCICRYRSAAHVLSSTCWMKFRNWFCNKLHCESSSLRNMKKNPHANAINSRVYCHFQPVHHRFSSDTSVSLTVIFRQPRWTDYKRVHVSRGTRLDSRFVLLRTIAYNRIVERPLVSSTHQSPSDNL